MVLLLAVVVWSPARSVARFKAAAPHVDPSALWIDIAKRDPMVRDVRGPGTLVPEDIQQIEAGFESQVSRILVRSGGDVNPDVGDDKETNCVAIHPGRASVNTIEIPDGLKPRDQVIVSDMSPRDRSLRIRLN